MLVRVAIIFALLIMPSRVDAQARVALVIGNSAYQHTSKLINPSNDASDLAKLLKTLGYQVFEGIDLDKAGMDRSIRQFARALNNADAGVFFYAGHGLQVSGQNYLVPIDAKLEDASGLDFEMVRLDLVHRTMERETKTNVIFLDACRDNPLARNLARSLGTRSGEIGRGLAVVESGVGTLISFSTQPGNVALDGLGRNSPYSEALANRIKTAASTEDLSTMLIGVRNDVMAATKNRQVPWEHSALRARFFFASPPAPDPVKPSPQDYDKEMEIVFWNAVKDSKDPEIIGTYLDRFPSGTFSNLARLIIERINRESQVRKALAEKEEELKRAEEAQALAEAKRLDEQRKLEEARRHQEERETATRMKEAKKAQAVAKSAEAERQAALKAAEQARKKVDSAKAEEEAAAAQTKRVPGQQMTTTAPNVGPGEKLKAGTTEAAVLARAMQTELKRIGCYPGDIDGVWGGKTKDALKQFASLTKTSLPSDEPTPQALMVLSGQKGTVCSLKCSPDQSLSDGQCAKPNMQPRDPIHKEANNSQGAWTPYDRDVPDCGPTTAGGRYCRNRKGEVCYKGVTGTLARCF